MLAVTNLPSDGHKVLSFNNTFLPNSLTSLASQGSDTHSPSTRFFKNNVGIIVLSVVPLLRCLSTWFVFVVLQILSKSYVCLFPSGGEANTVFAKSLGELIPESLLTTKTVAPLVTPEIILRSFP